MIVPQSGNGHHCDFIQGERRAEVSGDDFSASIIFVRGSAEPWQRSQIYGACFVPVICMGLSNSKTFFYTN